MTKPITPDEVASEKSKVIPPVVIESFNHYIAKHWNGTRSKFKQKHVVSLIEESYDGNEKVDKEWLDIEPIYEDVGWEVSYDKPSYCESYDATFEFKKKK